MNPIANLSIFCFIAFALLGSMIYMFLNIDKNDQIMYFMSLLNSEQQEVYQNITKERMNIYLQGFVVGIILGIIYLKTTKNKNAPVYCIFVAIVLGVTYINYTIMPKSTYMLDHIETPEQAQAWLAIYQKMKKTCHMGMFLGIVALPFICLIV